MQWYGICVAIALASMAICFYMRYRKDHEGTPSENRFLLAFPFGLMSGIGVAILLDALFTGDWRTWSNPDGRKFGLTFMGFLIGEILLLVLYGNISKLGARYLLNVFLPPLALAQTIGRIGCFLGGCCYGVPCSFGVRYPPGSYPYSVVGEMRLFPVQIVESICLFALSLLLLKTIMTRRMYVYVIGVSLIRFSLECFRYDIRGSMFNLAILSPQQILSIGLFIVFVSLYLLDRGRSPSKSRDCKLDNKG